LKKVKARAPAPAPGYSGKPLLVKLGMKPGARIRIEGAPEGYEALLGPFPEGVTEAERGRGVCDFAQLFVSQKSELERALPRLKASLHRDGMLWVSWPKRSSGVATDITESTVRTAALAIGLVDVKVCAVTEVWSGLKLVIPLKDRR
jgi:hypothetical protein